MPAAKKSDTKFPAAGCVAMRSPAGLDLLGGATIIGWPAVATPWNTVSTKLGLSFVPNLALKTWMQPGPHCGVAAAAGTVPTVLRPTATLSVAAATSTLRLMDMSTSFVNHGRARAQWLCWQVEQALDASPPMACQPRPDASSPGAAPIRM